MLPEDEDYETVAGLIGMELGRVPGRGDTVQVEATGEDKEPCEVELTVLRMDGLRVDRVRLGDQARAGSGRGGREMSTPLALTVSLLLLAGNAFFVGAEFALISARRSVIEPRAEEGRSGRPSDLRAMEKVSLMMAGAQLGITLCTLGLGALAEPAIAHSLEVPFESAGLPEALVHPVAVAIALLIVGGLHVVLGEMVPKNIALAGPDRSALALARR